MPGNTSLNVMVDSTLKEQAEDVLSALGLPMSGAITLFLKQIVLRKTLPFDVATHVQPPLSLDELTGEQLYEEVKKGYDDCVAGRTAPAEEAFKRIEAELGL